MTDELSYREIPTETQPRVINNTVKNAKGILVNTVHIPDVIYYVKINVSIQVAPGFIQTAKNLPYVFVRQTAKAPNKWIVVTVGKTADSITLPIIESGEYRLYIKEPYTQPIIGSVYEIPYHKLANGKDSPYEVQAWYAFKVTGGGQPKVFSLTTYLPNTLKRSSGYLSMGKTKTLTIDNATKAKAKLIDNYIISDQLWADCSQTYGMNYSTIESSQYKEELNIVYSEGLMRSQNNPHQRSLFFFDGATKREIHFTDAATAGARTTQSYGSNSNMSSDEAIRRIHPTVLIYWMRAMSELDIIYSRIENAWNPHLGSTRHRYSLGLDISRIQALIPAVDDYQGLENGKELIEIELNCVSEKGNECNPLSVIDEFTPIAIRRKVEFSRKFFKYLARGRATQQLGWLGGPWTLHYNSAGINYSEHSAIFIELDNSKVHKDHVHLTVGSEQD